MISRPTLESSTRPACGNSNSNLTPRPGTHTSGPVHEYTSNGNADERPYWCTCTAHRLQGGPDDAPSSARVRLDLAGNVTGVKDALGNLTQYLVDVLSRST